MSMSMRSEECVIEEDVRGECGVVSEAGKRKERDERRREIKR